MKSIRVLVVPFIAFLLSSPGASLGTGITDSLLAKDLDSLVGKQLGLTSNQSKGGIGAMLRLAKEKLSSADFDKVAAAIPGADKYLSKARSLGLLNKPMGNVVQDDPDGHRPDGQDRRRAGEDPDVQRPRLTVRRGRSATTRFTWPGSASSS